jgi:acetyl-CoA C-acetyltransferase
MRDVFVGGVGQTPASDSRQPLTVEDLVAPAVVDALAVAGMGMNDIDFVMWGVGPDMFEGQASPETFTSRQSFLRSAPHVRTNTGGATGTGAFLNACELVRSGASDATLVVAFQRVGLSSTQRILQSIWAPYYEAPLPVNTITQAAFRASRLLAHTRATLDDFAAISVKNHLAGSRNPNSHLQRTRSFDEVSDSRMLAWPVRLLDACPRSQGACAVVVTSARTSTGAMAVVEGWSSSGDPYWLGDRLGTLGIDVCDLPALEGAARQAYMEAGVSDPASQIEVVEAYAPFSSLELMMYAPLGLIDRGDEQDAIHLGRFGVDGDIPVNPSGGCQTSNPIGASGLIRVAEAALQLAGKAGEHQVRGTPRRAVATGTGGASQYFDVVVLGDPN